MSPHFLVLVSLGGAILLSPEIVVLGLLAASDRRSGRVAAVGFAAGAAAGIAAAWIIGSWIKAPAMSEHEAPTWTGFAIHLTIAAALLAIGLHRARNTLRGARVSEAVAAKDAKPSWSQRLLARLAGEDAPPRRRVGLAFLLGLVSTGPNPKVFPVAIAASHQAGQLEGSERVAGSILFATIASLPGLVPLSVELVRPGGSAGLRESIEGFLEGKGRWMAAAILIAASVFVGIRAWEHRPEAGRVGGIGELSPAAVER
jgi:hypothetical protein